MFFPLRNHTHYSLLKSTSRIKDLVNKCKSLGYKHIGICDINSISGCVSFIKECKKNGITPIVGCEITIFDQGSLSIFCKNNDAWSDLLRLISVSENGVSEDTFYSTINCENFICVDGYKGSIFESSGKTNIHFKDYYLESNEDSHKAIPCSSTFYLDRKDAIDHKVLMCVDFKTTLNKLPQVVDDWSMQFLMSSDYYIKTPEEIAEKYSTSCIQNMASIIEKCDSINILMPPQLPSFETPKNLTEIQYLRSLCENGLKRIAKENDTDYLNRLDHEMKVIEKANLAGYFLIVQDYVNYFANQGCLVGPARGSGGGSLVCYLTGITLIDPLEYDLLFERFYNEGRNTEDHISLPDIDVDFPPDWRDRVITYIKDKYGHDKVCQMVTFGKMAGRSILKEVLRANNACSFDEMNIITSKIPQESAISDLLEEMDNPSVIRWTLEHDPDALADYCWLKRNKLGGDYAKYFEQAMRMEGIYKTQGKHAAGVVISSKPLDQICPMINPKHGSEKIAGMEMGDLEAIGCVKFDILGVSLLKTIMEVTKEN